MDQVYVIRHKVLVEKRSVRSVARELSVSRNTVRRYVEGAQPCARAPVARSSPVKSALWPRVEQMLTDAPKWTGGKQRLTSVRLHELLLAQGHRIGERTVREMVAEWKRRRAEVFVPLVYKPGVLAEVDFFEVLADVAGERRKAWMFVMRLMYSGRDFAWLYPRQDQVAFLDGHVRAFEHFGCVPHRLAYDNPEAAVARHLVGSERELTARFLFRRTPTCARSRRRCSRVSIRSRSRSAAATGVVLLGDSPTRPRACCRFRRRHSGRRRSITSSRHVAAWCSSPALRTRCGAIGSSCRLPRPGDERSISRTSSNGSPTTSFAVPLSSSTGRWLIPRSPLADERVQLFNEEIRRRTYVVRVFPNSDACLRLVRALASEQHEEWQKGHRRDLYQL